MPNLYPHILASSRSHTHTHTQKPQSILKTHITSEPAFLKQGKNSKNVAVIQAAVTTELTCDTICQRHK